MTDAVVRMVRDTLARVRHLSPDAIRQESRALVDRLPFADRAVLRLWAVAILRCLPAPPARALGPDPEPMPARPIGPTVRERCAESRHTIAGDGGRCMCGVFSLGGGQ